MMRTIRELFGSRYKFKKHPRDAFGIEIETETASEGSYPEGFFEFVGEHPHGGSYIKQFKVPIDNWRAYTDNSLRNFGREFVFEKPLDLLDTTVALAEFAEKTKGIQFLSAPATSVHVHQNFCEDSLLTLVNYMTTWVLAENFMIEIGGGESRRSNLFARPTRVAEQMIEYIVKFIERVELGDLQNAIFFPENEVKYGAMNLATLAQYGSVEIRCMRGTTNTKDILDWVNLLDSMKEYASYMSSPKEILYQATHHPSEFAGVILDDFFDPGFSVEPFIERNLYYGMRIAECVPDWSEFGKRIEEVFEEVQKKKKKVDPILQGNELVTYAAGAIPAGWTEAILDDIQPATETYDEELD